MEEMNKDKVSSEETKKNENAGGGKKADKKEKEKLTGWPRVRKEIREWAISLITAAIVVVVMKEFLFLPIKVDGNSMNPTLLDQERLFVTVYDVKIANKLQKGDVVICNYPERTNKDPFVGLITMNTNFVKRIVGVPGDTVSRVQGVTYVNGDALDPRAMTLISAKVKEVTTDEKGETSILADINGTERTLTLGESRRFKFDYEYVLGEDEYFVVGDNRYNSHDSRSWNGPDIPLVLVNDVSGDVGPITSDMIVGRAKCVFWPISEFEKVESNPLYAFPGDPAPGANK
ncbi:MAG: signal peptidase I [Clostridiales bacterium]|nr:signal peptidase I [Clostridiales bacterium]